MKQTILLYKPVSITPLQLIHEFRKQYSEYKDSKLGYAGRLDPMADGLMLILAGDENKKRKTYEDLPKVYECEILFGISTDTYDVLGKINDEPCRDVRSYVSTEKIRQILPTLIGKYTQPYPPYSSQPVHGKPLYYWARKNKLDDISIPTKDIEIYNIEFLEQKEIHADVLLKDINERISKVTGDFRQEEILSIWKKCLERNQEQHFPVISLRISCSSGTYIRSLAHRLGEQIGTGAIALSITRIAIGNFHLQEALKLATLNSSY